MDIQTGDSSTRHRGSAIPKEATVKHLTYDGPREAKGGKPVTEFFRAWARFGSVTVTHIGTGPEVRAWTIQMRRQGASKVGYEFVS